MYDYALTVYGDLRMAVASFLNCYRHVRGMIGSADGGAIAASDAFCACACPCSRTARSYYTHWSPSQVVFDLRSAEVNAVASVLRIGYRPARVDQELAQVEVYIQIAVPSSVRVQRPREATPAIRALRLGHNRPVALHGFCKWLVAAATWSLVVRRFRTMSWVHLFVRSLRNGWVPTVLTILHQVLSFRAVGARKDSY